MAALSCAQPSLSPGCRSSPSVEMPRISKPWEAYWFCSSTSQGVSILQGPHQVAQKLMSRGLAFVAGERDFLPLRSWRVKSGAGLSMSGEMYCGTSPAELGHQLALRGGREARLGGLLAVFPIGPARPGKGGQEEQGRRKERMVLRFTGIRPLVSYCTRHFGLIWRNRWLSGLRIVNGPSLTVELIPSETDESQQRTRTA